MLSLLLVNVCALCRISSLYTLGTFWKTKDYLSSYLFYHLSSVVVYNVNVFVCVLYAVSGVLCDSAV